MTGMTGMTGVSGITYHLGKLQPVNLGTTSLTSNSEHEPRDRRESLAQEGVLNR